VRVRHGRRLQHALAPRLEPPFLLCFQTDALRPPVPAAVTQDPPRFRRPFFAFATSAKPLFSCRSAG